MNTLGTIAISVITSTLTYLIINALDARKERATQRIHLAENLSAFYLEYVAEIEDAFAARQRDGSPSASPGLTRLAGRLMGFQLRIWRYFSERKIRAAFSKLTNRLEVTRKLVLGDSPVSEIKYSFALKWMEAQHEELLDLITCAAAIPTTDPGRRYFVGFRAVTEEDKRLLSMEDSPPPWEFGVQFADPESVSNLEKERVIAELEQLIGDLKCPLHQCSVRIDIRHDKSRGAKTCCKDFFDSVDSILGRA